MIRKVPAMVAFVHADTRITAGYRYTTLTDATAGVLVDQLVLDDLLERYGKSRVLEGEHVAFTGTLRHGQRAAVQQLVSAVGGTADKNLTKKTTLLVVGIPNPGAWTEGSSASRKLHKARQLRESGSSIEVVSEDEFFNRLAEG